VLTRLLTLMAAIVFAAAAAAQTPALQWTQRVHPLYDPSNPNVWNHHNWEVALSVNRQGGDVIVSWMPGILYNVSLNGGQFNPSLAGAILPTGNPLQTPRGDPMTAFTSNIGFVGGLMETQYGLLVARKEPGQQFAGVSRPVVYGTPFQEPPIFNIIDKGWLVAGPSFGGGPSSVGVVFVRSYPNPSPCACNVCPNDPQPCEFKHLRGVISSNLGGSWPQGLSHFRVGTAVNGNKGGPNGAVILQHGPNAGRWIVAYYTDQNTAHPGLPHITWSNDGVNWSAATGPRQATVPGTDPNVTQPEPISAISPGYAVPFSNLMLALADDPVNPDIVYLAFSATVAGSTAADLFIARSIDGGATWPGADVLRLRDREELFEGEELHQILPAIAVDAFGGVDVAYYSRTRRPGLPVYRAKYARVYPFATYPPPSVANLNLAGEFNLDAPNLPFGPDTMGEYIKADARGCQFYVGFMSRHEATSERPYLNVYVSKVAIPPPPCIPPNPCLACPPEFAPLPADINADEEINSTDLSMFANSYAVSDPAADLMRDGILNASDLTLFNQSYACQCRPE
jgi:hypothetical protein